MNFLKKNTKVSVCIPTYNRYQELKKNLEFFSKVKNNNFEIVIIDDGSTDKTKDLVIDFQKKVNFTIKYFYHHNQGLSKSLQKGIMNSAGDYIIFQGSDDLFIQDVFNNFLLGYYDNFLSSDKTAGIIFRCIDHDNNPISSPYKVEQLNKYSFYQFYNDNRGDKKIFIKNSIYKEVISKYLNFNSHVPNSVYFMDIDKKYDFYFSNAILGIKSYLEGGITKNYFSHIRKNPNGWLILSSKIINLNYKFTIHFFILKVKQYINFSRYLFFALSQKTKISHLDKISLKSHILIILFSPIGLMLFGYDKLKILFTLK